MRSQRGRTTVNRKENANHAASGGMSSNLTTPSSKRVCQISTPEAFRSGGVVASTPLSCAKSLKFQDLTLQDICEVRVCHIPHPFMERGLITAIEKLRLKNKIYPELRKAVLRCYNYSKETQSAIVEFISPEVSRLMLAVESMNFMNTTVSFKDVTQLLKEPSDIPFVDEDEEGIYEQETIGDMDYNPSSEEDADSNSGTQEPKTDDVAHTDVVTEEPKNDDMIHTDVESEERKTGDVAHTDDEKSKRDQLMNTTPPGWGDISTESVTKTEHILKVCGLPEDYDKKLLKFMINRNLWSKGLVSQGHDGIMSLVEVNGTVEVELIDAACASHLEPCTDVMYRQSMITFQHRSQVHHTEKVVRNKILISQLPPGLGDDLSDYLKFCVNEMLWDAAVLTRGKEGIISCEVTCDSAVVEFQSEECASYLLSLKDSDFCGTTIRFNKFKEGGRKGDHYMTFIAEERKPQKLISSLEGDYATMAFVKECIKAKGVEQVFKGTEEAMKKVSEALLSVHQIDVSVYDCKVKKKRLDEQHRRAPHQRWGKLWAFIRGETDEKPVLDEEKSQSGSSLHDDVLATAKFTKGAQMMDSQIHALIDVWRLFKEEYWRAHKDSVFYKKIATHMVLRGHSFSPDQCKNKMDSLASDFKLYVKALKRTGQGRPKPWLFYVELQPILEGMVSVEAEHTYSAGATSSSTHSRHLQASDNPPERWGRVRPPAESKVDEKKELLKMMVESRMKLADNLKTVVTELVNSRKDPNNNKYL